MTTQTDAIKSHDEKDLTGLLSDDDLDALAGGNPLLNALNPAGAIVKAVETVYDVTMWAAGRRKRR